MAKLEVGSHYTRASIYELFDVPHDRRGGAWNRGRREWRGEMFVFATVGASTTSGHDYPNKMEPDGSLNWTAIEGSHSGQGQIQSLLSPDVTTHILVRDSNRAPFVYLGNPGSVELLGERPVNLRFRFGRKSQTNTAAVKTFREGAAREITEKKRERDPKARAACLEHWGSACVVCSIDAPWNHVHHLFPIAEGERDVNPITDLRPVCPSCHSMIHWFKPMLTIDEARLVLAELLTSAK